MAAFIYRYILGAALYFCEKALPGGALFAF
jgi:hypothetical protein